MMLSAGENYRKWNGLLFSVMLFLFVSSFFVPAETERGWIPLISGYLEPDVLYENVWWSAAVGIFFIAALVFSVYVINSKALSHSFNRNFTLLFLLLLLFSDPGSVYFSAVYPAAVCVVWGQYCFLEKQKFTAFFLLALGAVFYAPLIWLIPCAFLLAITGSADVLRDTAKCLSGAAAPFVYLFSFRYIVYHDPDYFLLQYRTAVCAVDFSVYSLNIATWFLILCILFIFVRATAKILGKISRYSTLTAAILKMELVYGYILTGIFFVFWSAGSGPLCILPAVPLSLVFSHYFSLRLGKNGVRIELILFLCALVIARVACFVN